MKIGKKTKLTNGTIHDIEYGDIFSFDFKSLKGTSFEGSNLGRSINEENPDEVIIKINQNQFGYFKGILEFIKDDKTIVSEEFFNPMFMNYVTGKDSLEFIKNEKIEHKIESKVKIEDIYLIPFSEFAKMKYLKEEKLEELKLNKPTNVVVHFFNMKEINEEMYPDCLTAKVYAFNKNGFVNFDTPEDIAEDKQYCLEEKKEYNPEMHIVDYSFNGLSNSTFNFMEEKGMFKNKIGKYKGEKLDFETLKGLLPQIKKLKNYSIKR